MRIAITMRSFEAGCADAADVAGAAAAADCFAELEIEEGGELEQPAEATESDETVQVTVVLRGKREELENPALGMTKLILGALRSQGSGNTNGRSRNVIDAMGIGVETAC
jgi:hypothetical protein